MRKILLVLLALGFALNTNAQKSGDGDVKKNIVKLNLGGLIFRTGSFQYERVLGKKISLAMGVRITPKLGVPSGLKSQLSTGMGSDQLYTLDHTKFGGYALTPEFRFYPGKKGAAKGFYLAPYFRYASYGLTIPLVYTDTTGKGNSYNYNLKGKASYISGGLMIGAQWIAKGGFTFDWWIGGGGFGPIAFKASVNSPDLGKLSESDKQEIYTSFNEGAPKNSSITIDGNDLILKYRTAIPSFRGGICLGWAF